MLTKDDIVNEKIAIHTPTQEQYDRLMEVIEEETDWTCRDDNTSPTSGNIYSFNKKFTCITNNSHIKRNTDGLTHASRGFYRRSGFKIISTDQAIEALRGGEKNYCRPFDCPTCENSPNKKAEEGEVELDAIKETLEANLLSCTPTDNPIMATIYKNGKEQIIKQEVCKTHGTEYGTNCSFEKKSFEKPAESNTYGHEEWLNGDWWEAIETVGMYPMACVSEINTDFMKTYEKIKKRHEELVKSSEPTIKPICQSVREDGKWGIKPFCEFCKDELTNTIWSEHECYKNKQKLYISDGKSLHKYMSKLKSMYNKTKKKLKNATLSDEEKALRSEGLHDECGRMTEDAQRLMLEELAEERWEERKEDIAKVLMEDDKE